MPVTIHTVIVQTKAFTLDPLCITNEVLLTDFEPQDKIRELTLREGDEGCQDIEALVGVK